MFLFDYFVTFPRYGSEETRWDESRGIDTRRHPCPHTPRDHHHHQKAIKERVDNVADLTGSGWVVDEQESEIETQWSLLRYSKESRADPFPVGQA